MTHLRKHDSGQGSGAECRVDQAVDQSTVLGAKHSLDGGWHHSETASKTEITHAIGQQEERLKEDELIVKSEEINKYRVSDGCQSHFFLDLNGRGKIRKKSQRKLDATF